MAKDSPHGTRQRYQSSCDCTACTDANTAYIRERRGSKKRWAESTPKGYPPGWVHPRLIWRANLRKRQVDQAIREKLK